MLAKASLSPVPLLLAVSKNWELHFGSVEFEIAIKQHLQYFNAVIHYQTSTILYYISGAVQRKIVKLREREGQRVNLGRSLNGLL